jgi:hypothetical protein
VAALYFFTMPFDDLLDEINELGGFDVEAETVAVMEENQGLIIDLLQDQMSSGVDADGNPLDAFYGPFYQQSTIRYKKQFGLPPYGKIVDHVTYFLFGDFYRAMYVVFKNGDFNIFSDVDYFNDIIAMAGERAMQLNEAAVQDFMENFVLPEVQRRLDEATKL